MIQARGLWADRRSDLALTFLLLVSILCMITGEFASGTADLAGREGFFAMPWQETEWRILSGKQEAIEEVKNSVSEKGEDAASAGCASTLLWKSTSPRLSRTAVWLALTLIHI